MFSSTRILTSFEKKNSASLTMKQSVFSRRLRRGPRGLFFFLKFAPDSFASKFFSTLRGPPSLDFSTYSGRRISRRRRSARKLAGQIYEQCFSRKAEAPASTAVAATGHSSETWNSSFRVVGERNEKQLFGEQEGFCLPPKLWSQS
ncbi:hypothetical protein TGVAND_361000 [Toxoplasma gondii VAND]|uniref:Uncharacterized protein n=1 Tax=Toxoplasma gondii VAND TaxID=933077 RepID=A0A086Q0M6_TOXGO|nr:hypothetical protein TGVAND_361000 [Toxoplasma gondii VAND]